MGKRCERSDGGMVRQNGETSSFRMCQTMLMQLIPTWLWCISINGIGIDHSCIYNWLEWTSTIIKKALEETLEKVYALGWPFRMCLTRLMQLIPSWLWCISINGIGIDHSCIYNWLEWTSTIIKKALEETLEKVYALGWPFRMCLTRLMQLIPSWLWIHFHKWHR